MAQEHPTSVRPFGLRDLLMLTTLAALVTWQVTALGWTDVERRLLGLAGGGSLLGILVGRLVRGRCWHWCLLGGLLGGVASIWPTATRLLAEQSLLKSSPEADEIESILYGIRIGNPLLGVALAVSILVSFQAGLWITSTHRWGLVPLCRSHPWPAAMVALGLFSVSLIGFDIANLRHCQDWSPRTFVRAEVQGRRIEIDKYCLLAISRDGRFVSYSSSYDRGAKFGICIFDVQRQPLKLALDIVPKGRRVQMSFGRECDVLAVYEGDLTFYDLPAGTISSVIPYAKMPRRSLVQGLDGPVAGNVLVHYLDRWENCHSRVLDCRTGKDVHSGEVSGNYRSENGDLLVIDPFTNKPMGRVRSMPKAISWWPVFSPDAKGVIYQTWDFKLEGDYKVHSITDSYARDGEPTVKHVAPMKLWTFTTGNFVVGTRPAKESPLVAAAHPHWMQQLPLIGRLWNRGAGDQIALLDPVTLQELATTPPLDSKVLAVAMTHNGAVCVAMTKRGLYVYDVPVAFR